MSKTTKYAVIQSFMLRGEVVERGDIVNMDQDEYVSCASRVAKYVEKTARSSKKQTTKSEKIETS